MKRLYIYLLLWLPFHVTGQQSINLSAPESGTKVHIARDYIKLLPGYSYKATGTYTMRAAIDEHIVVPTSYQGAPSTSRPLNTSYAVGSTTGGGDVTPTGAASYQIPITVLSGTGGVQPSLAFVYNSQSNNGLLGYGWNLAGTSMISRCGKTYYHDGKADGIKMNTSDNLVFDGQRLILVAGSNLANNSGYRTEIETYNEITYKTINSRLCFEVKTKDGWVMHYGSTDDSFVSGLFWLLSKVTDPNGNYMTYQYYNQSGETRLRQINYTGNETAGISPYNKVEFFYESRTDIRTSFASGISVKQNALLKRIKVSTSNSTFREYKLNYIYDGIYSKLTEVEEYGQNGARYNSTVVYWGNTPRAGSQYDINVARSTAENDKQNTRYGDFNGDGKVDFISYPRVFGGTNVYAGFYLSNKNDNNYTKCNRVNLGGFIDFLIVDMDGDGLNDIFHQTKIITNPYTYPEVKLNCSVYQTFKEKFLVGGDFYRDPYSDILTGDYNGDGKTDILVKATAQAYSYKGVNSGWSGVSNGGITDWGQPASNINAVQRYQKYLEQLDVNGNGKTDIMVLNNSGCKIYELQDNSFVEQTGFRTSLINNSNVPLIGDFNGDGLSDLLTANAIIFSTGTGFYELRFPETIDLRYPHLINFNGDNITDIALLGHENNKVYVNIGVFNGQKFEFTKYTTNITVPAPGVLIDYFAFEDVDGDGFSEMIYDYSPTKLTIVSFNNPDNLLVKKIKDGLNNDTQFVYSTLTQNSIYEETNTPGYSIWGWDDLRYPIRWQPFPLTVVMSIERVDKTTSAINYMYRNIRYHAQGKGFLCFEQIQASSLVLNRKTTTYSQYSLPFYNVSQTKQEVANYSGAKTSTTEYTNSYYELVSGSKRIFPYVSKQVVTDHLTGLAGTTEYVFNSTDDGNPFTITETRGNWKTVTTNTWEKKGSNFKNRLTNCEVRRSGLQGAFTETTGFGYDDKGRLTSQVRFKGNTKAVTTTYSNFDKFGNPQGITTSATGLPSATVTASYDPTGRFTATRTDAVGTSLATYDAFGRLETSAAIDGAATSYEYDGFDRLVRERLPTGNTISYSVVWDINGSLRYRTDRTEPGAPSHSVWYNASGQEEKTRVKSFSGDVYTKKEYNYKGQLFRSYLPGLSSPSSKYTEYTYDAYGRPASEIATGGTTTYSYNRATNRATYPDGTFRESVLNNSGLAGTVSDNGGSISYTYNSLGKPVTVTANGLETTIRYDNRGYQIALKDPNAKDTVRYSYDAYGLLRSQTNARGSATILTYDAAGRIISEVCPEMNLTYHYVTSGNGKGQLEYIKTGTTALRKIVYNKLGLPEQVTEKIDNTDYITKYTYDSYARLLQKESPSGFKQLHEYTADGHLAALRNGDNNALLWQAGAVNALGQVTSSTLGNGLTRTTVYDSNNLLQSITLLNGATPIDNVAYNFIPASGNLQQRDDKTNTRKEVFGYDGLNRLNSVSLNDATAQSITYKPNGNIEKKFDVGDYLYNKNNHAVSGIGNLATGYAPQAFDLEHTSFNRTSKVTQGGQKMTFAYGPNKQRNISRNYATAGATTPQTTRYYNGSYEKEVTGSTTKEFDYIYSPEGLAAIAIKTAGTRSLYYVHTDHLGSLRLVTNASKGIQTRYRYDAWGKRTLVTGAHITTRGFTGHEHLDDFGLINMNARMYDPALGRFLSTDPFVQAPDYTQSFNRYSYCLNNPLVYTDPDGEIWWLPMAIGAAAGMYQGGMMANDGQKNPFKWDYSSSKTWGYMAGGALVGGASGYVGGLIATSGIPFANTAAIVASSSINSLGTWVYTGGKTPISISFGVASYNFTNHEWGYLGKDGNKWYENLGYGFGALANIQDLWALNMGRTVTGNAMKDPIGHYSLTDQDVDVPMHDLKINISKGIDGGTTSLGEANLFWGNAKEWETVSSENLFRIDINNVNGRLLERMTANIRLGKGLLGVSKANYSLLGNTCTSQVSRALWYSGVWGTNPFTIHPLSLHMQLLTRQIGIYASPYLYNLSSY